MLPRATNFWYGDTVIIPLLGGEIKAKILRGNSVIKVEVCTVLTCKTITSC
jgi:hypothetical protein